MRQRLHLISRSICILIAVHVLGATSLMQAQTNEIRISLNDNFQILASQLGASHTETVIASNNEFMLSGSAGMPLTSSSRSNNDYTMGSGFWAQVRALRLRHESDFRRIDGSDNNTGNRDLGKTDTALIRLASAAYADGLSEPRGGFNSALPSSRLISNIVVAQTEPLFNTRGVSDLFWQWGQFIDHDIDLTEAAEPHESFPITVPADDPLFNPPGIINLNRSVHITDTNGVRQQINEITTWMDASQVYGSTAGRSLWKRKPLPDGTLSAMLATSTGDLLPYEPEGNCPSSSNNPCFGAGDVRANEQPGLTALHTIFMREHNRLVGMLRAGNPDWTEDELYETARLLVGSELQRITYDEWLPLLLGTNAPAAYTGYDATIDPSIANEFSTACFRFGHTMLSGTPLRLDTNGQSIGDVSLRDGFFNTGFILDDGIDPFLRGLMAQQAQELDTQLVDDVRNFLFGPPGAGGFDLAALNIQRGRDHGLASYNDMRAALGLARATSFADVTSDTTLQTKLAQAYNSIDEIDLWIGGLAEDAAHGGMLGETCSAVLADQFERLRDGDRFWHQNLNWIVYGLASDPVIGPNGTTLSAVSLADLIEWNSGVVIAQDNPFIAPVTNQKTVVIYAIAADNNPSSALSIQGYTTALLAEIEANTTINKTAISLIDFDRHGDTTIHVSHNGETLPILGLPTTSGVLDNTINEYDMSNGSQLGGFLKWALDTYADAQTQVIFEFIGHGTFVMPDGEYPSPDQSESRFRMTYEVGANPGYTDLHPSPSVIAPQDIRQMLEIGTRNGTVPLDVLDLTHCFAGTVEELYELVNDGAPYAEVVIASPSYGYVSETLFGDALAAINAQDSAETTAQTILNAYDNALTTIEQGGDITHPALWTVVDLAVFNDVKPALDALSNALSIEFNNNFADTRTKLQQAQQAAQLYDTSFAQADFSLDNTDALVDIKSYMQQLRAVFGASSSVGVAAADVESVVDAAILHTVRRAGAPYLAPNTGAWPFDSAERAGLALFAPFTPYQPSGSNKLHVPWQTMHYVQTPDSGYPNPFALLKPATDGAATWATIVQRFWATGNLIFAADLPQLTPMQQEGEIRPVDIVLPAPSAVYRTTPTKVAAIIHADRPLYGVQVRFEVLENGVPVFDEVVAITELHEGDNLIETRSHWTPSRAVGYMVRVSADSSNLVLETDEGDNVLVSPVRQIDPEPSTIITATESVQLFRTRTITFEVEHSSSVDPTERYSSGLATLYSFRINPNNGRIHSSTLEQRNIPFTISNGVGTLTLPETGSETGNPIEAGVYRLDVWGAGRGRLGSTSQSLRINYAPEAYVQSPERTFYHIRPEYNETISINVAVTNGSVRWYLWSPSMPRTAMKFDGNTAHQVTNAAQGTYVVMVERLTANPTVTLNVTRNGESLRTSNIAPEMVAMDRPTHVMRNLYVPSVPPTTQPEQTIELQTGWNIVSFFVTPDDLSLEAVFASVSDALVIVKNNAGQVYWPAIGLNQIGDLNSDEGYQVYMQTNATLTLGGELIDAPNHDISLPQGWSIIPFLLDTPLAIESALASLGDALVLAKNNAGGVYWRPLGINQIGNMQPGEGYQIYLNAPATLRYPLPTSTGAQALSTDDFLSPRHFTDCISLTGSNATVVIMADAILHADDQLVTPMVGDEIEIHRSDGLCVGAAVITGDHIAITAWGDDSQTMDVVDGLVANEAFSFRLWQQAENRELPVSVAFSLGNGHYQPNGFSIVSQLTPTVVDLQTANAQAQGTATYHILLLVIVLLVATFIARHKTLAFKHD